MAARQRFRVQLTRTPSECAGVPINACSPTACYRRRPNKAGSKQFRPQDTCVSLPRTRSVTVPSLTQAQALAAQRGTSELPITSEWVERGARDPETKKYKYTVRRRPRGVPPVAPYPSAGTATRATVPSLTTYPITYQGYAGTEEAAALEQLAPTAFGPTYGEGKRESTSVLGKRSTREGGQTPGRLISGRTETKATARATIPGFLTQEELAALEFEPTNFPPTVAAPSSTRALTILNRPSSPTGGAQQPPLELEYTGGAGMGGTPPSSPFAFTGRPPSFGGAPTIERQPSSTVGAPTGGAPTGAAPLSPAGGSPMEIEQLYDSPYYYDYYDRRRRW